MDASPAAVVVHSNSSLLACLSRMHGANHSLTMWNTSREFKVRLRNDPDDADRLEFDFGIVADEEDEDEADGALVSRILELEHDGFWDEGSFVVETYSIERQRAVDDPDLLQAARVRLNALLGVEICCCGEYLVKDGAPECLRCQLTAPEVDPVQTCGICHEVGPGRHMARQGCCGQVLHKKCLARCAHPTCPFCRHGRPADAVTCEVTLGTLTRHVLSN